MATHIIDNKGLDNAAIIARADATRPGHRIAVYDGQLEANNRASADLADRIITTLLAERDRAANNIGTGTWAQNPRGGWLAKGDFATGDIVDLIRRDGGITRVEIADIMGTADDGLSLAAFIRIGD